MRGRAWLLILVSVLGCEEAFDPRGTFENRMVLFAVLSPASDTVQVRVQTTYDPPTFDPLSHTQEPALSTTSALLWGSSSAVLRDTVIPHPDPARYTTGMHLVTAAPLRVSRGERYTVRVDAAGFPTAEATTTIPGTAPFYFGQEDVLIHPNSYPGVNVDLVIGMPPEAFGFLPRLFVEYGVLPSGPVERVEVPYELKSYVDHIEPAYPALVVSTAPEPRNRTTVEVFSFSDESYRYALNRVRERYGAVNVQFRKAVLFVTLVDEQLLKYYFIVNGYFDPYSIRTDAPDYSNVRGGAGLVGSYTIDSLSVAFPPGTPSLPVDPPAKNK